MTLGQLMAKAESSERDWQAREKAFWLRVEKRRLANRVAKVSRRRNRK